MRPRSMLLPLAALLLSTAAAAARFEVADDWPAVTFDDSGMRMVLFVHMPDLDVPGFDISAPPGGIGSSATQPQSEDLYVPLHALTFVSAARKDGKPEEDIELLALSILPTGYRLFLRLDPERGKRAIKRGGGVVAEVGTQLTGLLDALHLRTGKPEQVLVLVRPDRPAAAPPGALSDSEQAAIASMEADERTAGETACGGGPGQTGAADCWRGLARRALASHAQEASAPGLSPFTQRYLLQRLSPKGYARLARSLEPPVSEAWRRRILDLDMSAIAAAPAVLAKVPEPSPPAGPKAQDQPRPAAARPAAKQGAERPAPADRKEIRPAGACGTSDTAGAPRAFPLRRLALAFAVLSVVIFLALRRKSGK